MYISIYMYICIYIHIYTYICILNMCKRGLNMRKHIYVYVCIYVHKYIYVYVYKYICTYVYIYIYTYIYTHTHTHTHIYMHTHTHIYRYIYTYTCTYQAVFADEGAFRNRSLLLPRTGASMGSAELDKIRHFPASAKASYCIPNLYAEALAASQVCTFYPL